MFCITPASSGALQTRERYFPEILPILRTHVWQRQTAHILIPQRPLASTMLLLVMHQTPSRSRFTSWPHGKYIQGNRFELPDEPHRTVFWCSSWGVNLTWMVLIFCKPFSWPHPDRKLQLLPAKARCLCVFAENFRWIVKHIQTSWRSNISPLYKEQGTGTSSLTRLGFTAAHERGFHDVRTDLPNRQRTYSHLRNMLTFHAAWPPIPYWNC